MSWQASVMGMMLGTTFLFYWLSFKYDEREHALLKLFYTMMGWVMLISTIFGGWLLIPITELKLLDYYDMFLWITFILLVLVFLYWFLYISWSIGNGMLKSMWKDLRMKNNPGEIRRFFGKNEQP